MQLNVCLRGVGAVDYLSAEAPEEEEGEGDHVIKQ